MSKLKLLLILLIPTFLPSIVNTQSISLLKNFQISRSRIQTPSNSDVTKFSLNTPLGNDVEINDAWIDLGLNEGQKMDGSHVFVCRNLPESQWVKHYYTQWYRLLLKDDSKPTIGILDSSISTNRSNLICKFTVDNRKAFLYPQVDFSNPYM